MAEASSLQHGMEGVWKHGGKRSMSRVGGGSGGWALGIWRNTSVSLECPARMQHVTIPIVKPQEVIPFEDPEHQCVFANRHVRGPHAEDCYRGSGQLHHIS